MSNPVLCWPICPTICCIYYMLISTSTSSGDSKWLEQGDSSKSTTVTKKRWESCDWFHGLCRKEVEKQTEQAVYQTDADTNRQWYKVSSYLVKMMWWELARGDYNRCIVPSDSVQDQVAAPKLSLVSLNLVISGKFNDACEIWELCD